MKVSFVSSSALSQAMRYSMARMQAEMVKAQKELSTGRVADVGLALGGRAGQTVSLARDVERLNGLIDTNSLAASRLSSTQAGLTNIHDSAQTLFATLTANLSSASAREVIRIDGKSTLEQLTGILNTSLKGEYIFAGTNTDIRPIADYQAAGSPAKAAFDAAFVTQFGFGPSDPAAAGLSAADMNAFMTSLEPQFLGAGWEANWSSATDDAIVTRIALNETARTSVSANLGGVRKLAMASTMISELLGTEIGGAASDAVITRATELVSEALAEIADAKAATGITEQRVSEATERLRMQVDIFERSVLDLEGVDPYEASTRVSALLGQIELSYSLTARIQELSLARYLT